MHKEYIEIGSPFIKLAEECSELIKICMKIERFGLDNYHPITKEININSLKEEIIDVEFAIEVIKELLIEHECKNFNMEEIRKLAENPGVIFDD